MAEDYGTAAPFQHHYFHTDYQGTISLVTDDSFNPRTPANDQNELSDAFGQPRLLNGAIDPQWGGNDVTRRRYINQEDLLDAQLIDLNARLYDPELGKFLSPDPIIADTADSQTWNPYDYATNNPMSDEDPTGLCPTGTECVPVPGRAPTEIHGGSGILIIGGGVARMLQGEAAGLVRRAFANPVGVAGRALTDLAARLSNTPEYALGAAVGAEEVSAAAVAVSIAVTVATATAAALYPTSTAANDTCANGTCVLNAQNNQEQGQSQGDTAKSGDKPASTPTGQRGSPLDVEPGTNEPTTIGDRDYTRHALDRMQGRGVPPSAVEDAIQNGQSAPGNTPGTTVHTGQNGVTVVTGAGGQVITVIPK